ncbi:hypothetical protein BDA99DRAFT_204936 [Phascolomyces articulosus]|uniref:RRM domain-containing protein n=1 Tax=Phascolomyces articulosus TaxID=60185 RepID=A0AAD5PB96_9FUNG|nr:hypothetical protein BDA99DRAFT_204936 [Phascolomyces articulosus]
MAEEDVELREAPNTSQSSVVDDFLAALFARPAPKEQEEKKNTTPSLDAPTITSNSTNQNVNTTAANNNTITTASTTDDEPLQQRPLTSEQQQQPSLQQPYSPTQTYQANERNIPKNNSNSGDGGNMGQAGVKRDRTPDEFDEYEMLSKRKHGSRAAHQESGNGNSSSSNSNAMLTSNMTLAANDASIARYSTMPVTSNIDNTISSRGDGNSRDAGGGMNRNRMSSTSFVGGRAPNVMTEDTSSHHHEGDRQNMNDTTIGSPRMGGMMMASSPSHNHHQRAPIQRNRDQVIPDARMVVRGLPHGSKKREILDYFSRYGPILDAYFKDTAGFIQFATRDACMDAYLSENGNYFRGSQLGNVSSYIFSNSFIITRFNHSGMLISYFFLFHYLLTFPLCAFVSNQSFFFCFHFLGWMR